MPIGTAAVHPGRACHRVLLTVASVSPYAASRLSRSDQAEITAGGTVSVPTSTVQPSGNRHSGGRAAMSDGGRIACVTPWRAQNSVSSGPATRASSGTTTSREPVHRAIATSKTATSNPIDANWSTTDPCVNRIRSSAVATNDEMPSCGTTTPFGRPVDPEV